MFMSKRPELLKAKTGNQLWPECLYQLQYYPSLNTLTTAPVVVLTPLARLYLLSQDAAASVTVKHDIWQTGGRVHSSLVSTLP